MKYIEYVSLWLDKLKEDVELVRQTGRFKYTLEAWGYDRI